ncbi:hypothetical protein M569_07146 [Genlisea aurea]|uniref:CASP-like protein n=1 Tax=Genlisea aurea TaxID=192259 RepID=S8DWP0_9LAMI|nr:hypothetical protein M569_07146 [Genlisea aurea]
MSYLSVGVSPGNVPVSHGNNLREVDRKIRLVELVLRCVIFGVAIVSTVLIATDTQVKEIFSIRKRARFTDMKVLIFMVVVNVLAAGYSLVQLVRCGVSMIKGSVLFSKPLAWAIFSGDQNVEILAYLMLSAVAASLQSAIYAQYGEADLQWMKTCNLYKKFCNRMGEGIVGAVLVCLSMVCLSGISAFSLFRLYDDDSSTGKCPT